MTNRPKTGTFPKFQVGDMVQKIEFGPKSIPRRVEAVGDKDYTIGYIKVAGFLVWYSARGFRAADPEVRKLWGV